MKIISNEVSIAVKLDRKNFAQFIVEAEGMESIPMELPKNAIVLANKLGAKFHLVNSKKKLCKAANKMESQAEKLQSEMEEQIDLEECLDEVSNNLLAAYSELRELKGCKALANKVRAIRSEIHVRMDKAAQDADDIDNVLEVLYEQ